ncbi:MAG: hypothetical protein ACI837_003074, partial [Crocinitomicaceae bacterium]
MNTMKNYSVLLVICALILLAGCKKNPDPDFHFDYFGLEEGRYVVYDVVDITHDDALNQHDTVEYQLKTYWAGEYIDDQGRTAREFWRYTRDSITGAWEFKDIWTGIIDGIRAELIEENQRRIKLVFAPTLQKLWDANAYNMQPVLECYYRNIHQDTLINGTNFESTVVVEQDNFNSLIDTVRMYETYAKGVGLVSKYSKDIHFQYDSLVGWYLDKGNELYYNY